MSNPIFLPAEVLLPKTGISLSKWSVIACDQYTSSSDYWNRVETLVGDAPSTYRITLPEFYLSCGNIQDRIDRINRTMDEYSATVLRSVPSSYLYVERTLSGGAVRRGILGMLDLEAYSYDMSDHAPVRATEGTVLSRIPPRIRIRKDASLELPHVMLLANDREGNLFRFAENCAKERGTLLYSFELMLNGGSIQGWSLSAEDSEILKEAFCSYAKNAPCDPDGFPMVFAVGDGNHSLATAKACFQEWKRHIGADALFHPSRYALTEVVNLYDDSLSFEPIYRCLFGAEKEDLFSAFLQAFPNATCIDSETVTEPQGHLFRCIGVGGEWTLTVPEPSAMLPVGTLQEFLDRYLETHPGVTIDYIHGEEELRALCREEHTLGFLFEGMDKSQLFPSVLRDGVLPRKTFSMGMADDKRFYLESRRIR